MLSSCFLRHSCSPRTSLSKKGQNLKQCYEKSSAQSKENLSQEDGLDGSDKHKIDSDELITQVDFVDNSPEKATREG